MAWLRYSDAFTRDRAWDGVSYEARWHYKAMVEECSNARRWDGALPVTRSVRCSDTPNPEACVNELVVAGWLRREADMVYVVAIDDHMPPEGARDENLLPRKRSNQAAYRQRQCEKGNHSKNCPPKVCPLKTGVADSVTGNAGTGRDRSSTATTNPEELTDKEEVRGGLSHDVPRGDGLGQGVPVLLAASKPAANRQQANGTLLSTLRCGGHGCGYTNLDRASGWFCDDCPLPRKEER